MDNKILPKIKYDKVENRRKIVKSHTHTYIELYYLIKGETAYFVGDEIFHLTPGDFIIIPEGMIHSTDSQSCLHNERLLITFTDNVIDERIKETLSSLYCHTLIHIPESKRFIFSELLQKLQTEQDMSDPIASLYISELLVLLSRYKGEISHKDTESEHIINDVAQYIRQNYNKDICLYDLSKKFGLSEGYLSRKFKKVIGIGFAEYITQIRIFNAEKFLTQKGTTITQVAELCGFYDSNYFATVFKKAKGITPYKYKKQAIK